LVKVQGVDSHCIFPFISLVSPVLLKGKKRREAKEKAKKKQKNKFTKEAKEYYFGIAKSFAWPVND
jgi:hypothetical protein